MIFKGIKTVYRVATVALAVKKVMTVTDNGKTIVKAYNAYKRTKKIKSTAGDFINATKKRMKKIL